MSITAEIQEGGVKCQRIQINRPRVETTNDPWSITTSVFSKRFWPPGKSPYFTRLTVFQILPFQPRGALPTTFLLL